MPNKDHGVTLLRQAIGLSGLSARRFAVDVLARDERTIRRWLAGDSPLPAVVVTRLQRFLAALRGDVR